MKLLSEKTSQFDPILDKILTEHDLELVLVVNTTEMGKLIGKMCDKIWLDIDIIKSISGVIIDV